MFEFIKKTYSIKKDNSTQQTLDRLKKLYKELNIQLSEKELERRICNEYTPFSHRLSLLKSRTGANGKGKTKEASLCSAYSEFTERLQNGILFPLKNNDFYYSPDEIIKNIDKLTENELNFIKEVFFKNEVNLDELYSLLEIHSKMQGIYIGTEPKKLIFVPFYDLIKKEEIFLPISLIHRKNRSNGMSAGNTKEEALVQGFSEIFERYAKREIINNEYSLPTIPKNKYLKYKSLKGIIEYIEKINNISVIIKDASIGKNIPAVMTIFFDKETQIATFEFARHPDFPIAVERTLTEFMQGYDISDKRTRIYGEILSMINIKDKNEQKKVFLGRKSRTSLYSSNYLFKKLVSSKKDFKLNSKFINKNLNKTNKELLKEVIKIAKNLSDKIYIRDVSFLGFPSLLIDIPNISELVQLRKQTIEQEYCEIKFENAIKEKNFNKITATEILSALKQRKIYSYYEKNGLFIKNMPNLFISAIANIEINNIESAINDLEIVSKHNKAFRNYNLLAKNLLSILIKEKNINEYPNNKLSNLINYPIKTLFSFIPEEQTINNNEQINSIMPVLIEKYKNNVLNQKELKNLFE